MAITRTYDLLNVNGEKGWVRDSWARRAIARIQKTLTNLVIPTASTANPQMDGTAAPGVSTDYSRADHIHPHDTSKADAATTYTKSQVDALIPSVPSASTSNPAMDGTASPGSSTAWARGDHVHPSDTAKQDVLSAAQLAALNHPTYYGTCATAAATADKEVTCAGFTLATGAKIAVMFTYASTVNPMTLNVNGTGAKGVKRIGTTDLTRNFWQANSIVEFVYDGTNWVIMYGTMASTTYYGLTKLTSSLTSTSTGLALTAAAGKSLQDQINALSARITALGG